MLVAVTLPFASSVTFICAVPVAPIWRATSGMSGVTFCVAVASAFGLAHAGLVGDGDGDGAAGGGAAVAGGPVFSVPCGTPDSEPLVFVYAFSEGPPLLSELCFGGCTSNFSCLGGGVCGGGVCVTGVGVGEGGGVGVGRGVTTLIFFETETFSMRSPCSGVRCHRTNGPKTRCNTIEIANPYNRKRFEYASTASMVFGSLDGGMGFCAIR